MLHAFFNEDGLSDKTLSAWREFRSPRPKYSAMRDAKGEVIFSHYDIPAEMRKGCQEISWQKGVVLSSNAPGGTWFSVYAFGLQRLNISYGGGLTSDDWVNGASSKLS